MLPHEIRHLSRYSALFPVLWNEVVLRLGRHVDTPAREVEIRPVEGLETYHVLGRLLRPERKMRVPSHRIQQRTLLVRYRCRRRVSFGT